MEMLVTRLEGDLEGPELYRSLPLNHLSMCFMLKNAPQPLQLWWRPAAAEAVASIERSNANQTLVSTES